MNVEYIKNELKSINIEGEVFITGTHAISIFKLTAHRLKLWREGRGEAKSTPLKSIKLSSGKYIYSKADLTILTLLTEKKAKNKKD